MFKKLFSKFTNDTTKQQSTEKKTSKSNKPIVEPTRIGEIGEYKINIQLDQLAKNYKYLSDLMIVNSKSKSGYSQIDHVVFTPYAIFVIETKNYQGTIYGDRNRSSWSVNGKFKMMNPFNQNFGHIQAIKSIIDAKNELTYVSMVSFNRRCIFKVNEELRKIHSNDIIVYDTELSDYIMRKLNVLKLHPNIKVYSDEEIEHIYNQLNEHNISDQSIRLQHIESINDKVKTNEIDNSKCVICEKRVSDKVKTFCLSNTKRFNGKVYCYEHQ
ncbi:nuclease-related domain-containing protein [Bacillus sp. OAE603]|uniref:nuclease-related domain-containing protein n=1 Tax=Gottfriedia sp. OAE603 TaxID=2663872 RepID=UPI00178B7AC2